MILTLGTSRTVLASARRWLSASASPPSCEPLRLLFCGSDDFSAPSLHALHHEWKHAGNKAGIASIDVVCRPGKRTGRGLKVITRPKIHALARDLDLHIHEIDQFSNWQPPDPVNLIVAVSFGLLIPERLLTSARYGGLNLHPSMLPDLRGAAPIQHALLQRRRFTGVSLQTMHPTKFDRGIVLDQTPFPGLPIPTNSRPADLIAVLAPLGAEMLLRTLQDRTFIAPHSPRQLSDSQIEELTDGRGIALAPKITPRDRHLEWEKAPSPADVLLRDRVLGRLWDDTTFAAITRSDEDGGKRIIYESWDPVPDGAQFCRERAGPGLDILRHDGGMKPCEDVPPVQVEVVDRETAGGQSTGVLRCHDFTIEGGKRGRGGWELASLMQTRRRKLEKKHPKA